MGKNTFSYLQRYRLAILAVLVIGSCSTESLPASEVDSLRIDGLKALHDGDYAVAQDRLTQELQNTQRRDPKGSAVGISLFDLGALREAQGRFSAAEQLYSQALDLRRKQVGTTHEEAITNLSAIIRVRDKLKKNASVERGQLSFIKAHSAVGSARMASNGTITLTMYYPCLGLQTIATDDPEYESIIRHVGGLRPGEEKLVAPWLDPK